MNDTLHRGPLDPHLRQAASELAAQLPPGELRERIRRAVRREPRRAWWKPALAGTGAAAAVMALFVALHVLRAPTEEQATVLASDFVPVGTGDRWREALARGTAWLVPTELPQAQLVALGLPYDPARAAESVRAQLLVHSSGDVLAVRVIR